MNLPCTVDDYARLVRARVPYCQINYGDGEWACLLGREGENCNGEVYDPALAKMLQRTLTEPVGQWAGSNPGWRLKGEADAWIAKNSVAVEWVDKEVLPSANANGQLRPWLEAVRTRDVIVVGPRHLGSLADSVIGAGWVHVPVADATAWTEAHRTCDILRLGIRPGNLVLFACGMATNVMIHQLWPEYRGHVTMHDIGALLDPYVGVWSRNGYRKDVFQRERIYRNLGRLV